MRKSMFRRKRPSYLWPLLFAAYGCGAFDDFEITIDDEATIDGTYMAGAPSNLEFGGRFTGLELSTTQGFQDQGIEPSDVDAIMIRSVQIESINPEGIRLDPIIESVQLFVEAPGQARLMLAEAMLPADGDVRVIQLTITTQENLKPYATSNAMTMSANLSLKKAPLFTTTLKTTIVLWVDINLLGV